MYTFIHFSFQGVKKKKKKKKNTFNKKLQKCEGGTIIKKCYL